MGAMLWARRPRLRVHGLEHLLATARRTASRRRQPPHLLRLLRHHGGRLLEDAALAPDPLPVRSNFFYDHPLDAGERRHGGDDDVPPVLRTDDKQKRTVFNEYSVQRPSRSSPYLGHDGTPPRGTRTRVPIPTPCSARARASEDRALVTARARHPASCSAWGISFPRSTSTMAERRHAPRRRHVRARVDLSIYGASR